MHVLIAAVLFAQAIGVLPQPSCNGPKETFEVIAPATIACEVEGDD